MADKCMVRQFRRELDELCIDRRDFLSRCELEGSSRSTQTGRATGVDRLPGEILHLAASSSPTLSFNLHSGSACELQSRCWVEAHRGILVSSCVGKSFTGQYGAAQLSL